MPKIKISNKKGLVQTAGAGVQVDSDITFGKGVKQNAWQVISSENLTASMGGVYVLSGSTAAVSMMLPSASLFVGSTFIVRGGSNHANILQASGRETEIVRVYSSGSVRDDINNVYFKSVAVTFPAGGTHNSASAGSYADGGSIFLQSDGASWKVLFSSGALVYTP